MNEKENYSCFGYVHQKIISACFNFMELTREHELLPIIDGCHVYDEEEGKCGFQVASQYDRSTEYLQAFLDIIRVEFDPNPLGTFQLNSNLCFLYNSIPNNQFQLGYISIYSKENQTFNDLWNKNALKHLVGCGYDIHQIQSLFAVITTGEKRHGGELMGEVQDILMAGFTLDEVLGSFSEALTEDSGVSLKSNSNNYAGFCCDPALGNKLRLSLWIFIPNKNLNTSH